MLDTTRILEKRRSFDFESAQHQHDGQPLAQLADKRQ